ncbi:Gfo/Idh/MocA family oxidoreductase [Ectothiorhodospiraceae bacterium 2226]|nr:Gfo/Idh/MocA family oxidoreductase [Ectothiorhodospiraceae bacterium 2226]
MERLRLAVVGCGAVAELFHLPAAVRHAGVEVTALVDRDPVRAKALAERFGVPTVLTDWRDVEQHADAAVVALPHFLHAPASIDLLQAGVHVLVEKPMALSSAEAERMSEAAQAAERVLAVGFQCRFYRNSRMVKHVLESGLLGRITRFDVRQGAQFGWPVLDGSAFRPETGGGALTGMGIHALDLALWWMGDFSEVAYYDDAVGGVEADCELHLTLGEGIRGTAEFSHTRNLRNTWRIQGERGELEVGVSFNSPLRLRVLGSELSLEGPVMEGARGDHDMREVMLRQFDDFIGAVRSGSDPLTPGREGVRTARLYEACQRRRQPLDLPWLFPQEAHPPGAHECRLAQVGG